MNQMIAGFLMGVMVTSIFFLVFVVRFMEEGGED